MCCRTAKGQAVAMEKPLLAKGLKNLEVPRVHALQTQSLWKLPHNCHVGRWTCEMLWKTVVQLSALVAFHWK